MSSQARTSARIDNPTMSGTTSTSLVTGPPGYTGVAKLSGLSKSALSAVDLTAMSQLDDQDYQPLVLNLTQDAVIADSIAQIPNP